MADVRITTYSRQKRKSTRHGRFPFARSRPPAEGGTTARDQKAGWLRFDEGPLLFERRNIGAFQFYPESRPREVRPEHPADRLDYPTPVTCSAEISTITIVVDVHSSVPSDSSSSVGIV